MRRAGWVLLAVLISTPALAGKEEREAKALFKEGKQLAESGDYAGAAEMFQAAYARFPNPKILLNLAAVLEALGRNVEAAETYEKFVADPSTPRAKKAEIESKLADLEKTLGMLRVTVDPSDARITLDGKEQSRAVPFVVRVNPGGHALVFEKEGYAPSAHSLDVVAGKEHELSVKLRRSGEPAPAPIVTAAPPSTPDEPGLAPAEPVAPADAGVVARAEPEMAIEEGEGLSHAGQLGVVLRSETDVKDASVGPTVGVTYGALSWLELSGLALIQRLMGARIAASLLFMPDSALKPFVRLGVPMFLEGGTAVGFHGGAGLLWDYSRNLGIGLDVAAEHFSDLPGPSGSYTALLVGLGVQARAF